jgi:hypothetical protein
VAKDRPARKTRYKTAPLTAKEVKFLKAFVRDGETQSEAALIAGYSPLNPAQSAAVVMRQLHKKVPELFERIGLNVDEIFKKTLIRGLAATKLEHFSHMGIVMEVREVVDHEQRGKYLDRLCKLLRLYPNGYEEDDGPSRRTPTVVVNLGFLEPGAAKQVLENARKRVGLGDRGHPDVDVRLDEDA